MRRESFEQRVVRSSTNSWYRVAGFYQKSAKLAKANIKQGQLQNEKKAFGIAYMDMINNGCSHEELQKCIDTKRGGILDMQEEIDVLKTEATSIDDHTRRKLVQKKSSRHGCEGNDSRTSLHAVNTGVLGQSSVNNVKSPPAGSPTTNSSDQNIPSTSYTDHEFVVVKAPLTYPSAPPASLDEWSF
jgi:hypothetical protein